MSERQNLLAERKEAMKRSGQFVIYRVWRDQWDTSSGMKYQIISGYGLSIAEAADKAIARASRLFSSKIITSYGGGYEVVHGSRWH